MVENLFAFKDSLRHPVDRLVSMILGKRATTPLEKACQIVSDFEVFPAGSLAVNVKRDEQLVERFLIERPFLARCGLNMVLPIEHRLSGFEVRAASAQP